MQHVYGSLSSGIRALLLVLQGTSLLAQMPAAADTIDFDRDIRPILSNHCFACHGPDAGHRKADLRLDRKENAFAWRDDAPAAIVPGDAAGSALVQRIRHDDPTERMPPAETNKPLDQRQQQLLVRWIDEGATWAEHWSFVTPSMPPVPELGPEVARSQSASNAIDHFLLARLQREGLQPSPPADRSTLLRRVTLDLTGLPPTPSELATFLADDAPDAYERRVDRLLTTDAYGEHMARFWLDAARYGDTHGLHLDNYREMWLYRDWVVRAFRDNLPFDRFVVEQLAGDLLPDPTVDQRIASGFNRCHITTSEGGSIDEEVYVRNVIDRVSTAGTVFLGLTVGCAVCHDHKFDPISQREFYQLFAFFNNLDGAPLDGNAKDPAPVLAVPDAAQTAQLAKLDAQAADVEQRIADVLAGIEYEEPDVDDAAVPERPNRQTIVWVDDELPAGAMVEGELTWTEEPALVHTGRRAMQRRSVGNQQHYFRNADQKLRIANGDVLFAWVHLDPDDPPAQIMLQWNDDGSGGWNHRAYWGANKIGYGKDRTTQRQRMGELPPTATWTELRIPVAEVGLRAGMAVHGIAFTQFDGTSCWDTVGIETTCSQEPEDYVWIDDEAPVGSKLQGDGRTWQWTSTEDGAGDGRGAPAPPSGTRMLRRSGKGLNQDFFTDAPVPLRLQHGDRLFASVWLDPKDPPRSVQLQFFAKGNWNHRARWGSEAHGPGLPDGGDHVAGEVPETGRWQRLEVGIADFGLAPGDEITGVAFTQVDGTVYWDRAGLRTYGPPNDAHVHSLLAWQEYAAHDATLPEAVRQALAVAAAERSPEQSTRIRDHFLRHVFAGTRATFAPLSAELAKVEKQRDAVRAAIPTTLVMKERAEPKDAFVLERGQYDHKGDKVARRTPAALPEMPAELPLDRLGLARWLVDGKHPLTARVAVNRFWQQLFSIGLVKTSEDFGNQGERPSHPQLLDWLATTFVADGWDVQRLMKRMVMSSTYRQSANVDAALLAKDPDNRLLQRGPRFRLDGETLRDQALLLGGLLVRTVGGPGVKPPQPAGLWKAVGYSSSNTANFQADTEPDKVHRRSLYTFWKRTSPPPQMTTFDAPSREECRVRRERTNTPMQALLLMNDPQYVECARGFAERILREGGADDAARVAWALQCATCQVPSSADTGDVLMLLEQQRAAFRRDPDAAARLIAIGASPPAAELSPVELAAWTTVANLLLNLDAVVTKG